MVLLTITITHAAINVITTTIIAIVNELELFVVRMAEAVVIATVEEMTNVIAMIVDRIFVQMGKISVIENRNRRIAKRICVMQIV